MVEFYISTNPGEDFKPLVKVASGGELSRLMLAIKSAFSRKEGKTSIVFDEVDTGVSGRVAVGLAQGKIHKIGQHGQVLAISHLPQVIALRDYQFFIEKISNEHSTVPTVRLLTVEERVEEVAKMLAGDDVTEAALTQARELLRNRENKMTDYCVIGDVHGKAGMLEDLLQNMDGQTQLLFSRDLIDRGEDSRRVLEMVKDLVDNQGLSVCQEIMSICF